MSKAAKRKPVQSDYHVLTAMHKHYWRPVDSAPLDQWVLVSGGKFYGSERLWVIGRQTPTDSEVLKKFIGVCRTVWEFSDQQQYGTYTPKYWQPLPAVIP